MTKFSFKSEVSAFDFWRSTMQKTYRSMAGIINIVFTGAMLVLTFRFFREAKALEQSLLLLGCIWFPIIQPCIVYCRLRKAVKQLPDNLWLDFSDEGMRVMLGERRQDIPWSGFQRIEIAADMVTLLVGSGQGYVVTNRTMGQEREAFLAFVKKHC